MKELRNDVYFENKDFALYYLDSPTYFTNNTTGQGFEIDKGWSIVLTGESRAIHITEEMLSLFRK